MYALETANTLIPLSNQAQIALADCYFHTEKNELAREIFEYLLTKEGISSSLFAVVKNRIKHLANPEFTSSKTGSAIENPESAAEMHYSLAFYMGNTGYPENIVEQEIKRAIQLAPDHLEYRVGLAGFLCHRNRAREGYQFVAQLTLKYISSLSCECCLQRLANVFYAGCDQQKEITCLNRLEEIKNEKRRESYSQDRH
ncbi:MAG: hypothetical protein QM501_10905 [Gimesia sp.]